ncbi:MAG: haloacid dehalogenase [candidate division NC10 bacterium RBG_16_65_8]|nr:MAG: haloacid dehalogenase [candidate division NC10 bacterium RBG_16_65_8]
MSDYPAAAKPLADLQPQQSFFVGIDSDGCAFDSMEIKHKECFCPNIIKWWDLQAVSKYAREAAEFVNLYSKWRGINRWPALIMVFDLLRERPDVIARGAKITEAKKVREFMASGQPLSDAGLKAYMAAHPDSELDKAWGWTKGVNAAIADMVHGVPPFPYMRESLQALQGKADVVVVSATPTEALVREWEEHDIAKHARIIAGQEMGSKKQHLALAAKGKYAPDRILMMGDAPGDMEAAKANGTLFFPINPGREEKSWERFFTEGLARFTAGTYAGAYEAALIAEFEKLLPSVPPWKR